MNLSSRFFVLQGPVRADLSGRPFGLLFIWRPEVDESGGRYALLKGRHFGFWLPSVLSLWLKLFPGSYESLDCSQLNLSGVAIPHDWRQWPDGCRQAAEAAVMRAVKERPGCKIIHDRSYCDRRVDLSCRPLQLYRTIVLKKAA